METRSVNEPEIERESRALVVFARAPVRGAVKTRLAASLGDAEALAVYRAMGRRVMEGVARVAACDVVVSCTPDTLGELVRAWLGDRWRIEGQGEGDLGARMASAIDRRVADGAGRIVVIGTDCPDVDADVVDQAFDALRDADVVLGPASDGGYYLIGVQRALPVLFDDVPWSSRTTLRTTLYRAAATGLTVVLLNELRDIDTADDWEAWTAAGGSLDLGTTERMALDAGLPQ